MRAKKKKVNPVRKFKIIQKKVIFPKWPVYLADYKIAMPNGRILSRQIIEPPGAAVIIPKMGKDRYLLIKQFRFAARSWLWEWPAGGLEDGESIRQTAARELSEETGYYPRKLKKIASFYPTPGISSEIMHLFLAEDMIPRKGEQDEDEEIEVHVFSLAQIGKMIRTERICDGKTILGFFYLKNFYRMKP
ncbi:MAG: NUDIX hydrolase [Candidatus Omnitrophica bacterium]|nr:NUDIX hydrolase [Candidatus Omnitrophota bacterium]MDD5672513.1 NUDIX hydrolase [Candidatus Omnitrophota bacterium]